MKDPTFREAPDNPAERVWRRGIGSSVGMGVCTVLLGIISGTFLALGLAMATSGVLLSLLLSFLFLPVGVLLGWMTYLTFRLISGVGPAEIRLGRDDVSLSLPGWRSLFHRPAAFKGRIPYDEIDAIETRFECYGGQIELTSRLVRTDGSFVFLFDEGHAGDKQWSRPLEPVVRGIAEAAGVPLRELGMVEGRAKPFLAWMARPVPWDLSPLKEAEAEASWSKARRQWQVVALLVAVALCAMAVSALSS